MSDPGHPTSSNADLLAGWNVIVTRPRDIATPLVRGLRRYGAEVVRLPAQEIAANPDFDWSAALTTRDRVDAWIFTSPSAVRHALPLVDFGLPNQRVFAVGAATTRALHRHGLAAVAPDRQHNSEGLLELDGLKAVDGHRIAIVTAPGGRGLIATTLRERGAEIFEWPVYRRQPASWSKRQLDTAMAAGNPLLTICSSSEAIDILATRLPAPAWERLRDARWLVSSARLRDALKARDVGRIDVAVSALAADLVKAACESADECGARFDS